MCPPLYEKMFVPPPWVKMFIPPPLWEMFVLGGQTKVCPTDTLTFRHIALYMAGFSFMWHEAKMKQNNFFQTPLKIIQNFYYIFLFIFMWKLRKNQVSVLRSNLGGTMYHTPNIGVFFLEIYSRIKNYSDCNITIFTSTSLFLLWLGEITNMGYRIGDIT